MLKPKAWAEIDVDAICHNMAQLKKISRRGAKVMPVVKAGAYGHGAVGVAKALEKHGADYFAVATAEEALELRHCGIKANILVLGYIEPTDVTEMAENNITVTAVDKTHAIALSAQRQPLRVHITVDTGLHRLGFDAADSETIKTVYALENLQVEGIYSHLACADSEKPDDISFTMHQVRQYNAVLNNIKIAGLSPGFTHLQSSYGVINYSHLAYDYIRPGIALYGAAFNGEVPLSLKAALTLKTTVTSLRTVPTGCCIGYGREAVSAKDTRVAAVSIGYADGIPRHCKDAHLLINGAAAPIIGIIAMDQLMVDVTELPQVKVGDTAVVIGRSKTCSITVKDWARWGGTIPNEILAGIGPRVHRVAKPKAGKSVYLEDVKKKVVHASV